MKRVVNVKAVSSIQSDQVIDDLFDLYIVCLMFCRTFDLDIDSAMKRVISENQVGKGIIDSNLLIKCQHLNQQLNQMLDAGYGSEEIRLRMKDIGSQDGMELLQ